MNIHVFILCRCTRCFFIIKLFNNDTKVADTFTLSTIFRAVVVLCVAQSEMTFR